MLCCGISTSRLHKVFKFRILLVLCLIVCSIIFLLRSNFMFAPSAILDEPGSLTLGENTQSSSSSSSGSGVEKILKEALEEDKSNPVRDIEVSNEDLKSVENSKHHSQKSKDQTRVMKKSYLEIIDETNPSHSIDKDNSYPVHKLKKFAEDMNERQIIFNRDEFPNRPRNGIIVVVQVHKRLEYLVHLLSSLEKAKGVENILLIISSDWYSDSIMDAVKKIKFCQVLHVFFPFAEQLHTDKYPGTDPNDCPRDISRDEARAKKCNNAEYPDKYGHYREAKFTMTKHHWWWKANAVFDKLSATKDAKGPVVFLEEDHFVAPDFFHSLTLLHKIKQSDGRCHGSCEVLNLGMYVKVENYFSLSKNQVSLTVWRSYDHNMGMTLYQDGWRKIQECSEIFCTYDDYNWDWTLMHLSIFCLKRPLKVLSIDLPRVFHIGECGMHHQGECNTKDIVRKYEELIEANESAFFAKKFVIGNTEDGGAHAGVQNGGWGDKRDHSLCNSFVNKGKEYRIIRL
ncbi:alpha-1,6-mannosyl-glycoprotein 2-beta-N-acetylglucosaminyltransferase-like [Rhopilema esculentum]|uniref:alpha-1,6-mannosyl-glycoprotein 2-beta-N-acetylglucosaminyltransferase-like n=1 Tax=Rhopilema esculentum TaxID=499914 RepID=UPI0031CFF124